MPFTPFSTASVASSAVMIPFRTRGSEVRDRSQAMSFHVTEGSSSSATYLAKAEPRSDSGIPESGEADIRDPQSGREGEGVPLVLFPSTEERCVDRETNRLVSGGRGSPHKIRRDLAVLPDIQLEPAGRRDGGGYVFEGLRCDRTHDHDRP